MKATRQKRNYGDELVYLQRDTAPHPWVCITKA